MGKFDGNVVLVLKLRWLQNKSFFSLPEEEKESLFPKPESFNQGYFGVGKEKVRGQISMKENFDFGDTSVKSSWPKEELLPGFHEFAVDFHQVSGFFFSPCFLKILNGVFIGLRLPHTSIA